MGKEPELVGEVEHYLLDIVGLTSTQSLGSLSHLLESGSPVGVGILTSSWLYASVLVFSLGNERVDSL